jgi:cell division protein FtsB
MIDTSIRIGDIAVVASLAGTCLYYSFIAGKFTTRIDNMQTTVDKLEGVVTTLAVQKERLDSQGARLNVLDARIEDLRRGQGFIRERGTTPIDREY